MTFNNECSIYVEPLLVMDWIGGRIVVEACAIHGAQRDGVRSVTRRRDGRRRLRDARLLG